MNYRKTGTRIATAGCHSCATISINGWGSSVDVPEGMEEQLYEEARLALDIFYHDVLYPTAQKLDATPRFPFPTLMKALEEHNYLSKKVCFAVLAEFQEEEWRPRLEEHGFRFVEAVDNEIGTINYVFIRNGNPVDVSDVEEDEG